MLRIMFGTFLVLVCFFGESQRVAAEESKFQVYPQGYILNFRLAALRPVCREGEVIERLYTDIAREFEHEPDVANELLYKPYVTYGSQTRVQPRIERRLPLPANVLNDRHLCGPSWEKIVLLGATKYVTLPHDANAVLSVVMVAGVEETAPGRYRYLGKGFVGLHNVLVHLAEPGSSEKRNLSQVFRIMEANEEQ